MADEEEIVVDIADILPLQKSIYWESAISTILGSEDQAATAMGVKNAFAQQLFGKTAEGMESALLTDPETATRSLLMSMNSDHWSGELESQITLDTWLPNNNPSANWNSDADLFLAGRVGDIGEPGTSQRAEWFNLLRSANANRVAKQSQYFF